MRFEILPALVVRHLRQLERVRLRARGGLERALATAEAAEIGEEALRGGEDRGARRVLLQRLHGAF